MRSLFYIENQYFKEFLAEIFGTFFLCLIGLGGNAQNFFSAENEKNPLQPAFVFGSAVTISCNSNLSYIPFNNSNLFLKY